MLLAIDIGNTDIAIGIFEGNELKSAWHIATVANRTCDEYAIVFESLLRLKGLGIVSINQVVLCCVAPPLTSVFEDLCHYYFNVEPLVVRPGIRTGVRILVDNPQEIGSDRIVNAVAAHHFYCGPVIVVDLGTATTFDAVSREGDYLGGAIAPGIGISAEALFVRTAMLPRIEMVQPKRAIGTSTVTAMQSGIFWGYVGLVEGMISRIQHEIGEKTMVIATGNYAETIAKTTALINTVNPDLTLSGLRLIYFMNKV